MANETVADKTVFNDSTEVDTSSFFQETKVIRRATGTYNNNMIQWSDFGM